MLKPSLPFIQGFQVIAVELFGAFMGTTPLNAYQWGICIAFGATELIIGVPPLTPAGSEGGARALSLSQPLFASVAQYLLYCFQIVFDPLLHS